MRRVDARWAHIVLAVLVVAGAGCAARNPAPAAGVTVAAAACEVGDTALVRDVLYFGRNRPDGGVVSDAEWQSFLDGVVTARFPAGLTVVDATGQWRGQSGVVERERAQVLTVLHAGDEAARRSIAEIAAEYKQRFKQEALLRERTASCVRF
jgi:hypothetical protein